MAIKTLLAVVQDAANSINKRIPESLDQTLETTRITNICIRELEEIYAEADWPFMKNIDQLESVSDANQPTKLKIPDNMNKVNEFIVRYRSDRVADTTQKNTTLHYIHPSVFITRQQALDSSATNTTKTTTNEGTVFYVLNDRPPNYYTSFDDNFIFLNSYDSAKESTVQQVNTTVISTVEPSILREVDEIVGLPNNFYVYWQQRCRASCWADIKNKLNQREEAKARKSKIGLFEFYGMKTHREIEYVNNSRPTRHYQSGTYYDGRRDDRYYS